MATQSSVFNSQRQTQDVNIVGGTVIVAPSTASTATLTSVLNSVASFVVLAANASRKGVIIYNDSNTQVSIAYAATASATAFTLLLTAKSSFFMSPPIYLGIISAIANANNGSLRITEM